MAAADGYGGGEEQYMYHVPQQSRREKLRFHESYLPNPNPNQFLASSSFAHIPSSSSSNNNNSFYYATTAASSGLLAHHHQISNQHHHQQQQQPFSLSLSTAPPPPRQHQHQQLMPTEGNNLNNPAPLGPFTGYAEILNRSRFLEPARQMLEEICNVGGVVDLSADRAAEAAVTAGGGGGGGQMVGPGGGGGVMGEQQQWKKTRLISMLDEVYRRYKLYYQQVQVVVSSFESVPGLGGAAPYASMALKVMSNHFRCLKNAISDQLHQINKTIIGKEGFSEEENSGYGLINRSTNNYGTIRQPHVWRPQRGLPERAVAVLRAWLFEHFLHPYPTDTDKQMLAKQTGLTRNQVSNWFINARVRLWKPMVEEIHSLEVRQKNKAGAGNTNHTTDKQAQLPSSSTATSSNDPPFQNTNQNNQNQSSKRPHDELMQMHNHIQEPNYAYEGFPGHHNIGIGVGVDGKGNGGVSLTLGLHQNNGICSAEPIPLNVVRRLGLGLEECNDPYVIGSFGGQDRHIEKDIGGHLLHDFVG